MAENQSVTDGSPRNSEERGKSQELLEAIRSLGDRRILLVVDRGLIRFGKYVAAQIAIFGIIGVFLFGADIKDSLKEVRKTRQEMKDVQQELKQTRTELGSAKQRLQIDQQSFRNELASAKNAVSKLQNRVEELKQEADIHLARIRGLRTEAEQQVVLIRQLTVDQQVTLTRVTKSEVKEVIRVKNLPDTATEIERKQAETLNLWTKGTTLCIRFLDGTKQEREEVKRIAYEWTKYGNIRFSFIESGVSHVRVTLRPENWPGAWAVWAYHGTTSLGIDQDKPTMAIDVANQLRTFDFSDENVKRGLILREFGFVLGLIDEIRNPNAKIPWDTEAMPAWEIDRILPYSESELPGYRQFDPNSVMLSYISNSKTKGDFEIIPKNYELSESDKNLIGQLYPF